MSANAFIGKAEKPTDEELATVLGPAKAIWDRIFLTQNRVNQSDIFRPLIHAVYAALEQAQPMN